jgi:hypothetical protein
MEIIISTQEHASIGERGGDMTEKNKNLSCKIHNHSIGHEIIGFYKTPRFTAVRNRHLT